MKITGMIGETIFHVFLDNYFLLDFGKGITKILFLIQKGKKTKLLFAKLN